jgi:gluconolactonase
MKFLRYFCLAIGILSFCDSVRAEQFVLFDATFTYTKEDADNATPSKSHYYVRGKMLNAERPKDWTAPVDYRNGTAHIRAEVIEKPPGGEPTTWTICYIPIKGQGNGYGCMGTDLYREKGVYEKDVSMKSFWENNSIVWSEGIKEMHLVIKDGSGGSGHAHKRADWEKFFPTKMRITVVQVSAGAKYDPSILSSAKEELFKTEAFTPEGSFTEGIEGPACDRDGNIYAVNFGKQQTIGRTTPDGKSEIFVTLPGSSVGNGIVFDRIGKMFVADYVGHNVLRIDMKTRAIETFAHNDSMNQPNDLAIDSQGTIFASDPAWKNGTGQLWRVDRDGKTTLLVSGLGTSNGIDVSPDDKTLYVNESVQRNVWAWTIAADKSISNKRLIRQFPDFGFDGMRCDVDGNLYISRHGKGTVVKMTPAGEVLREIDVLGKKPSNLCFGGPDGRTIYVTEVEHTRLVKFRVDQPGLAWKRGRE